MLPLTAHAWSDTSTSAPGIQCFHIGQVEQNNVRLFLFEHSTLSTISCPRTMRPRHFTIAKSSARSVITLNITHSCLLLRI